MNKCAFDNGCKCMALEEKQCLGCSFRKSQEELVSGRQKAAKRVVNLPDKIRVHILRKYYDRGKSITQWLS